MSPFLPLKDILRTRFARTKFALYAATTSSLQISGINLSAAVLLTIDVLPPGYVTAAMINFLYELLSLKLLNSSLGVRC